VWDDEPQKSCFRIFTSAEACYRAHSEFLLNPKKEYRYGFLFKLDIKDYKGWANGLQTSGYASSKTYATKLISLIERYSLHELDTILPESSLPMPSDNPNLLAANEPEVSAYANVMADANMVYPRMNLITTAVAAGQREKAATNQKLLADNSQKIALPRHPTEGKSPTAQEKQILSNALLAARSTTGAANKGSGRINGLDMVYAQNVEELTDIAKKQKMAYRRLLRINELQNTSLKQGQPIYLNRKLKKFHEPNAFHIVSARQTLYDVAQMYGIRTKSLRRLNKLSKGMPLAEGMRLRLS
jgi:LysM repeat protein